MSTIKKTIAAYKAQESKDAALRVLENGVSTLEGMTTMLKEKFPFEAHELSKAEKGFEESIAHNGIDKNAIVDGIILPSQDAISLCINNIQAIEAFIMMSIPPMEDGNNFGVSVQHAVAKFLQETREKLSKTLESVPTYYDKRASAVEKLNLTKTTSSITTTNTKSESTGGKDGDENKSSKVTVEEEKKTGPVSSNPMSLDATSKARVKHIVALDVQFYGELRSALVDMISTYSAVLDNVEKNYDKLSMPKGTSEGRNMMSMF